MPYPCCCPKDCPSDCSGCAAYTAEVADFVHVNCTLCNVSGNSMTRTGCTWTWDNNPSGYPKVDIDCVSGTPDKWRYRVECHPDFYELQFTARSACPPKGTFYLDKTAGATCAGDDPIRLVLT